MTNHLGEYFWERRRELGWGLGEVARRLGYENLSKGANKVQRFERDGIIGDDFLRKLAALYDIGEGVVRYLSRADRIAYLKAWEEWADQPTPIRIAMRAIPGFMVAVPVPDGVATPEQAVAYAQTLAAAKHKKVFVTLSRREMVGVTELGEVNGHFYARPDADPCPLMSLGRVKFLFRTDGFGAVERYVHNGGTPT